MPVSVWTSTLKRTIQTAELLPFPKLRWKVCASATVPAHNHLWPTSSMLLMILAPQAAY